jgi:hypothetical protein
MIRDPRMESWLTEAAAAARDRVRGSVVAEHLGAAAPRAVFHPPNEPTKYY